MNFITAFLRKNFGDQLPVNEAERVELEFLRKAVATGDVQSLSSLESADEANKQTLDSEESDDEFVGELPPNQLEVPRQKLSISSEVYESGKKNIVDDFEPPIYEKTAAQEETIRERMAGNFMFDSLDPRDREQLVKAFRQVTAAASDVIIRQGDDGDQFYLIEEGRLTCTKEHDGKIAALKQYGPGETFGELALLYNAPRAATITVDSESATLWSLDRLTFACIIKLAVRGRGSATRTSSKTSRSSSSSSATSAAASPTPSPSSGSSRETRSSTRASRARTSI